MNTIPSLEDLSFKIILENFSRYVLECQRTQDENVKKNMFFLQRKYSKLLLKELDEKKLLEELHLDFLLNEHLQELDVALVLLHSTKDKIIEKLIPISHSFVELSCSKDFSAKDCLDTLTAIIPHAVNVQKINIPYICNDEILKLIASSCPHLSELDIKESSEVTDQGLKALCENPENPTQGPCKLTILDISDVPVTSDDVMILLKDIPTLKKLSFDQLPSALHSIHKEDIDNNVLSNAKKYNLTTLDFSEYYDEASLLTTLLTICAELCPYVKKLVVPISKPEDLDACHLYSELESFTLDNYKLLHIIDINNFLLQKGKKLKNLCVNNCALSVSNLIESCPKLESLGLKSIQYEQMSKKPSKVLQNLNELEFEGIHFSETLVTDSVIALLNASPNVETLHLYQCEFGESTLVGNLSRFAFSTSLKHLYIVFSDLGVYLVQQIILSCNSLETLSLDCCENISAEDVNALNEIIKTSNRKIEITCNSDDQSDFSYSDYEFDNDVDYDVFDGYYDYDTDYDENDDDDYDDFFHNQDYW